MTSILTQLLRLPDLRRKIVLTVALLILFRFMAQIPLMPFDRPRLDELIKEDQLVFAWDMQSGGVLSSLSILSLGLSPYFAGVAAVTALARVSPSLREMATYEPRRLAEYHCLLAVPYGLVQSVVLLWYLQAEGVITGFGQGHLLATIARILTLTAGALIVHWLAELITKEGIGKGGAILVFGGVTARLPFLMKDLLQANLLVVGFVLAALLLALLVSIMVNKGERRITLRHASFQSRKIVSHLPIPVNRVGTGPLEMGLGFVSSYGLIALPIANLGWGAISGAAAEIAHMLKGTLGFWVLYTLATVYYAIRWQDMTFEGDSIARTLSQRDTYVPGLRRGQKTAAYLERSSDRIATVGVLYLGVMAIYPYLLGSLTSVESVVFDAALAVLLGFDTILDTMHQLEIHIKLRGYNQSLLIR